MTVTVEVAGKPFPKGCYGVLVRVKSGNKKYDHRMSVQACDADEAGRKAIEVWSARVGAPVGAYKQIVRY